MNSSRVNLLRLPSELLKDCLRQNALDYSTDFVKSFALAQQAENQRGVHGPMSVCADHCLRKSTLHLIMGLPGSGKSLFSRLWLPGTFYVSKDRMSGSRKEAKQNALLDKYLCRGLSVCLDNTNVSRDVRAEAVRRAKKHHTTVIGYFVDTHFLTASKQNRQRERDEIVPRSAMLRFYRRLEYPSYDEGFDELYRVRADTSKLWPFSVRSIPK